MCGIAGYIGQTNLSQDSVEKTLSIMKNRGPNCQKFIKDRFEQNEVILLHSRLSIIDIDKRSDQPYSKDNLIIIFNGEIYNFIEIRKKLINHGHHFQTNSDTEVIIEAYKRYRERCVEFFEGMWAFVIFDKKNNNFFFSRDRFGEKPLYILENESSIYFGSEIKFIFSLYGKSTGINSEKIRESLVCGFRSNFKKRDSFFIGVKELIPGTNMSITKGLKKTKKKYWSLKFFPENKSKKIIYEKVEELLLRSVKLRLRSDIPIAFCLSGGIDSSTLVALASKISGSDITTFSIIDNDKRYDESDNIKNIVDHVKCKNITINTSKIDFIPKMEKIISYYYSPVPTISYYIHNQLCQRIKEEGFSVVISGTGADEIFTGYYDHYLFWLYEMRNEENFEKLVDDMKNGYGLYINNPLLKDPLKFIQNKKYGDHLYQSLENFQNLMKIRSKFNFSDKSFCSDMLRNRMLNELLEEIVPVILFADDLNCMMYSIENRSPFLDKELVSYMYSIQTKNLIQDGLQKYLLRQTSKNYLPGSIAKSKKKVGFNASINSLIDLNDKNNIDWLLCDSPIYEIVDKVKMEKLLTKDFHSNEYSKFLFTFISSKIFMDKFSK